MKKLVVLGLAAVMALGAPFSVCAAEEETTVEHGSNKNYCCRCSGKATSEGT